ncbi:unnamed protein product [Cylindrotheca closterium]|uniref:Uncharacterized protein n=1 Tax=Cylindrotheca closterium TaxID=2856 RepID=A0AAD2FJ69_9STRA|nr:unnamed protein product [Cylindrotheca closterium]
MMGKRTWKPIIVATACTLLQHAVVTAFTPTPIHFPQQSRELTGTIFMAGKGFGDNSSSSKKAKKTNKKPSKDSSPPKSPMVLDDFSKDDGDKTPTEYPAMNRAEISKWLSHIPVYAVTDAKGNAKAIKLGDKAVVYFFMSSVVAEAYKKKLQESGEDFDDATVSGLFLGNIWYDFLDQDCNQKEDNTEFRLVPDPRDLTSARTVLSMASPEEIVESEGDSSSDDDDEKITIESLMENTPFASAYNEIPLFYVDNMPLADHSEDVKKWLNRMVSSTYMFFSAQGMFKVLDKFKESGEPVEDSNDALCSLFDIVSMMEQPSTTDFRNIVLIPPAPIAEGTVSDSVLAKQLEDPSSLISQSFFLQLLQDESSS